MKPKSEIPIMKLEVIKTGAVTPKGIPLTVKHTVAGFDCSALSDIMTFAAYIAILKTLKSENRDAFYHAMSEFVTEDEFNDAMRYFNE